MPDDAHDAHYRLAVALALTAIALRAREELGVVRASWTVQSRASAALAQELKSIRASANTRLVAIVGALCAVCAVTKPSEKSFDAFSESLERALSTTTTEDASRPVGTVSLLWGRAARLYRAYARAVVGGYRNDRSTSASFVRAAARAMGARKKVTFADYVVARTAKVNDAHAYVGVAGYWWGPFPSFSRAKRAGEDFVDAYGGVIAEVAARATEDSR
jgi:hypothetical protein